MSTPPEARAANAVRRQMVGPSWSEDPRYELGVTAYKSSLWKYAFLAAFFALTGIHEVMLASAAGLLLSLGAYRVHVAGTILRAFGLHLAITAGFVLAATWYLGWDSGYPFFLVPPCVYAAFSPGAPHRTRALYFAAALSAWIAAFAFLHGHAPAHPLPGGWLPWVHAVNVASSLVTVALWGRGMVDRLTAAEGRAAAEHARSESLLANILPAEVSARLKRGEEVSEAFERVSVVFADMVGFTPLSARKTPAELVSLLDTLFSRIDALAEKHGVEKIKTVGDAYMAAAGLPRACEDPAQRMAAFALELVQVFESLPGEDALRVRVGIATGPVVAGVIGSRKFAYDAWGDTVNTAARMESHGAPGRVHVDEATRTLLGDAFLFEDRGLVEVKGKGPLRTWFLVGYRAECVPQRTA